MEFNRQQNNGCGSSGAVLRTNLASAVLFPAFFTYTTALL